MLALEADALRRESKRPKHFESQHTHLLNADPFEHVYLCLVAFNL
jgi:hypothetical protein